MKTERDLLILGGGCAGLSLARELAALGTGCPATLILEQRPRYENDRTWCFWGDEGMLMTHLVEHRWQRAQLRAAQRVVDVDCSKHPYQMISARRFYDDALHHIAEVPQIELEQSVTILAEPKLVSGVWEVDTSTGVRRGRTLIDTRGGGKSKLPAGAPILWQSFLGQVIVSQAPVFDPTMVTLMDFANDRAGRIVFTYVLPLSARRALIELTVFGTAPVTPAELALPLQRQLRARAGHDAWTVERTEHGILPMGHPPTTTSTHANYLQVGLMHGAARASTGYAFQRIQRWARQCAMQVAADAPLMGHPADPILTRSMDRLFLSLLRSQPALAPALFLGMFERSETDRLVRFLSDRAVLRDYLGIISALPALPFIRQIGRHLARAV